MSRSLGDSCLCEAGTLLEAAAVVPRETKIFAVGGVGAQHIARWRAPGVDGIGVRSDLYKPGLSAQEAGERAAHIVAAFAAPTR